MTRIAALIAAHHNPEALERLLDRLNTPLWEPYVHISAKSQFSQFAHLTNKARFSEVRIPVRWGGFGLVRVTLHLLRMALQNPAITHFYFMSGECFPIKDDDYIRHVLSESNGNFFTHVKMPVWHKPLNRIEGWHFNDTRSAILQKILPRLFRYAPRRDASKLLRGMQPYGGSTWWMLSRPAVEKALKFLRKNEWYADAYRFSFIPDEMFFQTLLLHLGIVPDRGSPTATKWINGASHPEPVTRPVLDELTKDWHFLARKFVNPSEIPASQPAVKSGHFGSDLSAGR